MRIFRAEFDKLMTLPPIWITLMSTFIVHFVLAVAFTSSSLQGNAGTQSLLEIGLASIGYVKAGFIILGILATCSEYSGGQVRTTLIAMPWRRLQLSSKYIALAMITIPAALIIVTSGILYSFIMIKDTVAANHFSTIIASIVVETSYLTITALLSAAIGSLLKRSAPALVILISYYFVAGPFIKRFLPRITSQQETIILMLCTLLFITLSLVVYHKRDA